MGYTISADLETSQGPSEEVYVRIESFTFNKVTSEARFQLTYWMDKESAHKCNRVYLDEEEKNLTGLIQERVLHFNDDEPEGKEILFPHMLVNFLTVEEEVEIPIFDTVEVAEEIPYTSFDEEGEEITLYRTVKSKKKVKTGTKKEVKRIIDHSLTNNYMEFGYKLVGKMLLEHFTSKQIENS